MHVRAWRKGTNTSVSALSAATALAEGAERDAVVRLARLAGRAQPLVSLAARETCLAAEDWDHLASVTAVRPISSEVLVTSSSNNLINSVEHVRKTIGFDVDLCAEVDFRLTPSAGLVLAKALEPFRMFWLEEVFAPEDLAWHETLRRQCSTPIAWGEVAVSQTEWVPLVANRWIDFMRMHISACGGLNMGRKVAAMCEFFGIRTAWHGPGNVSPVGHAVNTHIDFAVPNFGCGEGAPFSEVLHEIFPGCPERKNGMTYSNDRPGLGIDIDEKVAAKYTPKTPGSDRGVRCYDGTPCRP